MPYIVKTRRELIDENINSLIEILQQDEDGEDKEGDCNYIISRIVAGGMKPKTGWRYKWLSRAHEVFVAAGDEFSRRLLGPYEDKAVVKNGDIPEYQNPF